MLITITSQTLSVKFHHSFLYHKTKGSLTFGQVFGQRLHVVRSVFPGGVGTQVSTHGLHLLLQRCLRVFLGSLRVGLNCKICWNELSFQQVAIKVP